MKNYFFFIVPVLVSCIGEDVIDDEVEPRVVITNPINSIQVGEGYTFTINFFDNVGMDTIPNAIQWTSSNDTIATIDEKGTLMTLNAGMVDITVEAQLQELMATTQFTLRILGRKPRITITNPRVSLPIMTSSPHQFEFTFFDDVGQEVAPTSIMWSSSDENILTITSDDGTVTPLDTGTANIRLQTGIRELQVDTTFSLQIVGETVRPQVMITPIRSSLPLGVSHSFSFMFFNNRGEPESPTSVMWSSSDENVLTIDQDGRVTSVSEGTATINLQVGIRNLMASTTLSLQVVVPLVDPEVIITNPRMSLSEGTSHQFRFTFLNNRGEEATPTSVMWSSSDANVLTIADDGTVIPVSEGTATITLEVSLGDLMASTTLSLQVVVPLVDPEVIIINPSMSLTVGTPHQFGFTFLNNRGEEADPTSVTWSSSDANVLTIAQDGMATPVSEGMATITLEVSLGDLMASTTLSLQVVLPLVDPVVMITNPRTSLTVGMPPHQFGFTFLDDMGNTATPTSVVWSSTDANVLTIAQDGTATPVSDGMATITLEVSLGDLMATTTLSLQVSPDLIDPVVMINNPRDSLSEGMSYQFGFTFFNDRGEKADTTFTSVMWSSSNENVLTIDQDGRVTSVSEGTATITLEVSLGDLMATTTLSLQVVVPLVDPVVIITNPRTSLTVGMPPHQFEFTFLNNRGEEADPTSVIWSSPNENILTIDADDGTVIPVSAGMAPITLEVSLGDLMASTTLSLQIVLPLVDPEVIITNPRDSLSEGMSYQFGFTFFNDRGEEADPTSVIWSSSDANVLTIAQDGTATPVSAGMATITLEVSSGDIMATTTLSLQVVRPLVDPVVMITNPRISLCVGMSYPPFVFTFLNNREEEATPTSVIWSSSDANVLTIAQDGTATPVFSGMATITLTVSLGDLMATTTLSIQVVSPLIDPVVMITNPPTRLAVGTPHQFEFEFFDDMGNTATPTSVVWSSTDANVLTIAQDGTATPVSGGMAMITLRVELRDLTADTTINVVVSAPSTRSGSIARSSGYTISGDFTLTKQGNGIVIRLESNYFSTGIPGLVLYLSNGPNQRPPNDVRRVGSIDSRGSATGPLEFTVDNVGLFDYSYLLFWCEPFNIKITHGQITN